VNAKPVRVGLVTATVAFAVELLVMEAFELKQLAFLPPEMQAIVDGMLLGLIVGPAYFFASRWWAGADGHGRIADAITIALLAMGFEGVLHTPLNTLTADLPIFVGNVVNAAIVALVLGSLATWLMFVRRRVAAHGKPPNTRLPASSVLVAGALLAAAYVAAMPSLSVFNNMMSWERVRGSGELINLAGRQRMLSERIGRLALLPATSERQALTAAIAAATVEGTRVDELAEEFVESFVPDGSRAAGASQIADLKEKRATYLATARSLAAMPAGSDTATMADRLQAQVNDFVAGMDRGVGAIQGISDDYADRQVAVIPVRLWLGAAIIFGAVLGLIWPILRLVHAQQWKLEQRRIEAEAANAAKAEFLANMSHELRTPLTAMIGFTSLLQRQSELGPESQRMLDRVAFGGRALLSTVNDVLDYSKVEAGRVSIDRTPNNIRKLVSEIAGLFESQAAGKGIDLTVSFTESTPGTLVVDSERLRQVMMNLIGNALKFTEAGLVELTVGFDYSTNSLRIAVTDTGPGISPRDQAKLFHRFSQVDSSSTRRHGGTGLGLAICKGIVEAMGGEIGVNSEEGRGSTFWFNVPAAVAADLEPEATDETAAMLAGARVLIVDDSEANRQLATMLLQVAGCETETANDGEQALALVATRPFDAILVDLYMPGLAGDVVAERIRTGGTINANTPLLMFSADRLENSHAGLFDGVVLKPFSAKDILAAIKRALNSGEQVEAA
jgi:signal transduction histidine kinase/ActR/RegA family two-component response regulator